MLVRHILNKDWVVWDLLLLELVYLGAHVIKAPIEVTLASILVQGLLVGQTDGHSFLLGLSPLGYDKVHIFHLILHTVTVTEL